MFAYILGIDQDSLLEKNVQVPLMGRIYSIAYETLIFIAPVESPLLGELIRWYKSFRAHCDIQEKSTTHPDATQQEHVKWRPDIHIGHYQAVMVLMDKPWFRRAWVVQEFVLSQRQKFLIAGEYVESCEDLRDFCGDFDEASDPDQELGISIAKQYRRRESLKGVTGPDLYRWFFLGKAMARIRSIMFRTIAGRTGNLVYYLDKFASKSLVSDQRDLVHAFLGLQNGFEINVEYGLTVEQVFIVTARAIIAQSHSLALLGYTTRHFRNGRDEEHQRELLPSWVPDWRVSPLLGTI